MLSKVCNPEDRYAITHVRFDTLKSSCDTVQFLLWELIFVERQLPGIYFEEEGFFEISKNKLLSKITRYTVHDQKV